MHIAARLSSVLTPAERILQLTTIVKINLAQKYNLSHRAGFSSGQDFSIVFGIEHTYPAPQEKDLPLNMLFSNFLNFFQLALVSILATRWRHLHCHIAWDCPLTSSVGIELLSSSARVTSVKSAKPLVLTD